jgi:hypothetical protein
VESLVTIAKRFREGGKTIRRLFEEANPDLSDRSSFEWAVEQRLRHRSDLVDAWQGYSRDKRTSDSPYLDGVEVGFYDRGRRDVVRHRDEASACADFLFRETSWVLNGRDPGAA